MLILLSPIHRFALSLASQCQLNSLPGQRSGAQFPFIISRNLFKRRTQAAQTFNTGTDIFAFIFDMFGHINKFARTAVIRQTVVKTVLANFALSPVGMTYVFQQPRIKTVAGQHFDINAVITNHAPFCVGVAASCKSLPAALDDMAQIIGPTAKVSPDGDALTVLRTLKGRNACLIRNGGVVATGRTLDEAFTGSMVLEKGALCYVGSTVIGKSVRIGLFDALLMRFVYKTKYSKKDQTAKQQELKA